MSLNSYELSALASDPREDRLPKWARDKLANLRHALREAGRRADDAIQETNPDEALAVIERCQYQIGLKDDRVTFKPRKGADYLECIEVQAIRGGIEIHARSGPIHVYPTSSNVVRVKAGETW